VMGRRDTDVRLPLRKRLRAMLAGQRPHQGVGLGGDGVPVGRIGQPGPDLGELQRSGGVRHQTRVDPGALDEAYAP
jgi:hypothetical protein